MIEEFEIIFEDEYFVVINKPTGILVHRTKISEDRVFVLQILRKQIKQRIYPVHRLDRATSGVLIFGKTSEAASQLGEQFMAKQVQKKYWAIIRGFVPDEEKIDYPLLTEDRKQRQEAITIYKRLKQIELPFAVGRYPTARYSYVEIQTETGRRHQIRRHFSHLRHPIIGDKRHGDVKHNKFFKNELQIDRLLLHARFLKVEHPFTKEMLILEAQTNELFDKALGLFESNAFLNLREEDKDSEV